MAKKIEEKDFISGLTVGNGPRKWIQRLVDSYGLILMIRGECEILFECEAVCAESGDLLLLQPGFKHHFKMGENAELLWFHFLPRPHVMSTLDWPLEMAGLSRSRLEGDELEKASEALQEAHLLDEQHLPNWNTVAVLLLETTIARGHGRLLNYLPGKISQTIQVAQKLLLRAPTFPLLKSPSKWGYPILSIFRLVFASIMGNRQRPIEKNGKNSKFIKKR